MTLLETKNTFLADFTVNLSEQLQSLKIIYYICNVYNFFTERE